VSGERAKELGLVFEAVDEDQVLPRSLEIARDMAAASPIAVQAITETLRGQTSDLEAAIDREAFAQSKTYQGEDMTEGLNAVMEKRKPQFQRKE